MARRDNPPKPIFICKECKAETTDPTQCPRLGCPGELKRK